LLSVSAISLAPRADSVYDFQRFAGVGVERHRDEHILGGHGAHFTVLHVAQAV